MPARSSFVHRPFFFGILIFGFLIWRIFHAHAESTLRFTEIVPNPVGSDTNAEFLELFNGTEDDIDLSGWKLSNANKSISLSGTVLAESYRALYYNKDISLPITNSGDTFKLLDASGNIVDSVTYTDVIEGSSYSNNQNNEWHWTPLSTPNTKNSFPEPEDSNASSQNHSSPENETAFTVRINEILPDPSNPGEKGEFIELFNFGTTSINLKNWVLRDASKTGKYIFKTDRVIAPAGYILLSRTESTLSLNNTTETLTLFDPAGNEIDRVSYEQSRENLSYNFSEDGWRWSKLLTPGKTNRFSKVSKPEFDMPKQAYVNMPVEFEFENDDPRFEYTWDFGDKSSKSHLAKTRHTYKKTGKYTVIATVFNGSEELLKRSTLEVKKFPRLDIRIVNIMPNPSGEDTENEWLEITNFTKKSINLKNWIVATGWDTMINHVIHEDFIVDAGNTEILTKDFASFSLNNTRMKLELRTPDKKTVQSLQYDHVDASTEDELFSQQPDGSWAWKKPDDDLVIDESVRETLADPVVEEHQPPYQEIPWETYLDPSFIGKQSTEKKIETPSLFLFDPYTTIKPPAFIVNTFSAPTR